MNVENNSIGFWAKFAIFVSLGSAVATLIIAIQAYNQTLISRETLGTLKSQLRISNRPKLVESLTDNPAIPAAMRIENIGKGEEKWKLPYYIINNGDANGYKVKYYHGVFQSDTISHPSTDSMQTRLEQFIIYPGEIIDCGYDVLYRQEVLDAIAEGKKWYRHFFTYFEDEFGNGYSYWSVWVLSYRIGDIPEWNRVSRKVF